MAGRGSTIQRQQTGITDMTDFFGKVLRDPGSEAPRRIRKPWWQTAKTARQGFVAAALWAILGLIGGLVAHRWFLGAMGLVLAGINLASAAALGRREQASGERAARVRAGPPGQRPGGGPGRRPGE
jgi:hypothetical protein